jgi:hypothetical protein
MENNELFNRFVKSGDLDNGMYENVVDFGNGNVYTIYGASLESCDKRTLDFINEIILESDLIDFWVGK